MPEETRKPEGLPCCSLRSVSPSLSPPGLVEPQLDLASESPGELARPDSPTTRNQRRTFLPASQPRPPSKRTERSLAGCAGVAALPELVRPASAPRQI